MQEICSIFKETNRELEVI